MSKKEQNDPESKKVFFITSNQSKYDHYLNFEAKTSGLVNLKAGIKNAEQKSEMTYKRDRFSVYINSMEIVPKELKKKDQDPKTKRYNGLVNLQKDKTFPGTFTFMPSKNNFVYDFVFTECKGWVKTYPPPPQIKFSKLEQLKLYISYMKNSKIKQQEKIYKDLIVDSQSVSFGQRINLDYFLEILKNCYSQKEVKLFLKSFKLENIDVPEKLNYKDYEKFLNLLEKRPEIIIQYCKERDNKEDYYKIFYTLLLFVRCYCEIKKANEMIGNKNLWKYFAVILPDKVRFFPNLTVSDELINQMFDQPLTIQIIQGILSFCDTMEKILTVINDKKELISKCCIEHKTQLKKDLFLLMMIFGKIISNLMMKLKSYT